MSNQRKRKHHPNNESNEFQEPLAKKQRINNGSHNDIMVHHRQPTLQEMEIHPLFKIAKEKWLNNDNSNSYDATLVNQIYLEYLSVGVPDKKQHVVTLEFSQYLEKFRDYIVSSRI